MSLLLPLNVAPLLKTDLPAVSPLGQGGWRGNPSLVAGAAAVAGVTPGASTSHAAAPGPPEPPVAASLVYPETEHRVSQGALPLPRRPAMRHFATIRGSLGIYFNFYVVCKLEDELFSHAHNKINLRLALRRGRL